ncbi:DUF1336 family protein [Perilla frutescens var. frutescens]|nr:DUF1336 family protein [Perilla frutescens var. frutescens]
MHLHISLCVELFRPPVEEDSFSFVVDSDEFVLETPEDLMMLVEEFVPETPEASMWVVEDTKTEVVIAMEIEAQGGDWRVEVANSMLQILLPWYFKVVRSNLAAVLVRSNPGSILLILVGFVGVSVLVIFC